ncbi:MAG: BspA family leucine-rich repeat surface protein [Muribaculaceae bacterium]|nr:BspA family leucine-rich repeat surface protein [Muribaculaceae bacterium]
MNLHFRFVVLVAAMLCALGASAQEAYAVYTTDNTTLSFYYDTQRSSRPGTTYDLNTGYNYPDWYTDGTNFNVTKVVFDPSFAGARPTSTIYWFFGLFNLQSITGLEYLNTSEVTDMAWMFFYCTNLTSLDLSHFNTSKVNSMYNMLGYCQSLTSLDLSSFNTSQVISMSSMFDHCANLRTIYVGDGWNTAAVTISQDMFKDCTSLVGGQGTTYDANHIDATYAHIDGGPSNPGYFTAKNTALRGDVNGDHGLNISDAIMLISAILNDDWSSVNMVNADVNFSNTVDISDAIMLINYVLNESWP